MKSISARLRFSLYRGLDDLLSPDVLYRVLQPFAVLRAGFRGGRRPTVPPFLEARGPFRLYPDRRVHFHNQVLECLVDRLSSSKWSSRCRMIGGEQVAAARRRGKPVILAFCHFGPCRSLRLWLRTVGQLPVAILAAGAARGRPPLKRLFDRIYPFPEVPTIFYLDQVRELTRFVAEGNVVLMALDHPGGRRVRIPVDRDWSFEMCTGAMRLAVRHEAELFPCVIASEGHWRFRVEVLKPVPPELLVSVAELGGAGRYLLEAFLPVFRSDPAQCSPSLLSRFQPVPSENSVRAPIHSNEISDSENLVE